MPGVKRILVVDDDSINLQATDHLLKSFGYATVTASSGPEALEKLPENIQLVLLDVMMPGMDGFEVARRIREDSECGDVPIIMTTALTGKADRLLAVQAGANDFVSKPLDRVELEIRIASHLKLKEAQDKRRESDARYRLLVENSPVGILCCDPKGEIKEINPAASDFFGISPNEPGYPKNLFDNPDIISSGISIFLKSCLESNEVAVKDFAVDKRVDKHARLYVVPVRERGGHVLGLQVVAEDISDSKRAEELSRRRTRLMAFAEMARGSVRHFSETLKRIDEQAVAGLVASDSGVYPKIRPPLEKIRVSIQQASQTLNLLQKFARGYSKRDTTIRIPFDFSDAIREALEASEPAWKATGISLECDFVKGCFIEGERADVVQLAAHLIRNAAEAMPRGGNLRAKTSLEADHVIFEVQDDGVGMTQDQIKHVGSPFWTSKESHVGLGLAVSLGIIRRHFGTFSISSKKERGTIFTVKFPLTARHRKATEEGTLELLASNPKVLFVDPDDGISRKAASQFQKEGPVYFARSIEEAEQVIHEKNIDAIVCSEALPATRIVALSKKVSLFCATKGTVRPPFIVLSNEDGSDRPENSLSEAYVDRILLQPLEVSDLMQIVKEEIRSAISRPRIAGNLGHFDILDVVQMMLLSGQRLVLEMFSPEGKRGLLYISDGEICHAQSGDSEGEDAAYWALCLKSGSFSTLAWVKPKRTTIDIPGQLLLIEAARKRDEGNDPLADDPDDSF